MSRYALPLTAPVALNPLNDDSRFDDPECEYEHEVFAHLPPGVAAIANAAQAATSCTHELLA